jgi:hypothetical protein
MPESLPAQPSKRVQAFLDRARTARRGRVIFAVDATGSREHAWDLASKLQVEMFQEATRLGSLDVQLVHFGGGSFEPAEFRIVEWTSDPRMLTTAMARVRCKAGPTQYRKVLEHIRREHAREACHAAIIVGDMIEDDTQSLLDAATGLNLPLFIFQEAGDPLAQPIFQQMARLTNGAYAHFDAGSAAQLRELLRAVVMFAVGGLKALENVKSDAAVKLLEQMKKKK